MSNWHHGWKTDIGLRLSGAMSFGVSYIAIKSLMAWHVAGGQMPENLFPLILAAIGFLCASAGSVLLVLGHHIFDQVEVSQRWQNTSLRDGSAKAGAPTSFESDGDWSLPHSAVNEDNLRAVDFLRRA